MGVIKDTFYPLYDTEWPNHSLVAHGKHYGLFRHMQTVEKSFYSDT